LVQIYVTVTDNILSKIEAKYCFKTKSSDIELVQVVSKSVCKFGQ